MVTAIVGTNLLFFEPLFCEFCCYSLCCETNSRREYDLNACHSSCPNHSGIAGISMLMGPEKLSDVNLWPFVVKQ